jgi:ferric-dicitrate binding protein FerR (iron transport regulator)
MDASDRKQRAAVEAAEWWVVLQGDVSRGEREAYVDWLRESSLHVAEMLRVAQVHGALAQFERWNQIPSSGSGEPQGTVVPLPEAPRPRLPRQEPPKRTYWRVRIAWSVAATLLIIAGLAALFFPWHGQVIETQRGERREMALADGTVVQVDPETVLRVDYEPHTRRVVLERGRALFHVAKNAERPFLVRADGTTVRAVGTAFAVEQRPDAVVVTVAEGKVAVFPSHASIDPMRLPTAETAAPGREGETAWLAGRGSPQGPPSPSAASTPVRKAAGGGAPPESLDSASRNSGENAVGTSGRAMGEIFLTANEQVTVAGSGSAAPIREVDSTRALAWADGRLIFEDESVERAVAQFNRYNRIQISINDTALARRPISGVFSASDPESFVAFIQTVTPVRIIRDDAAGITIQPAR